MAARAAAGEAAGVAAGARWLTKAIASNMHDHRGRQQKQQRAKQWTLMIYLRRQQRRRHLGHPRTGQRQRQSPLDGAEYDAETEDVAESSDAAAAAGMGPHRPVD